MLSSNDTVLAIALGYDGEITGRTLLQKVGYFISVETGSDLGYRAHFYGPYSSTIAATVNEMIALGELEEEHRQPIALFQGHDDARGLYHSRLTGAGRAAADIHRNWSPDAFDRAVGLARKLKQTRADYMQLAFAAKTHFILYRSEREEMSLEEVRNAAAELRWPMNEEDVVKGVGILRTLGYVS